MGGPSISQDFSIFFSKVLVIPVFFFQVFFFGFCRFRPSKKKKSTPNISRLFGRGGPAKTLRILFFNLDPRFFFAFRSVYRIRRDCHTLPAGPQAIYISGAVLLHRCSVYRIRKEQSSYCALRTESYFSFVEGCRILTPWCILSRGMLCTSQDLAS